MLISTAALPCTIYISVKTKEPPPHPLHIPPPPLLPSSIQSKPTATRHTRQGTQRNKKDFKMTTTSSDCLYHPDQAHMYIPNRPTYKGSPSMSTWQNDFGAKPTTEAHSLDYPNPNLRTVKNALGEYGAYPVIPPTAKAASKALPSPVLYQRATRRPWDISTVEFSRMINKRLAGTTIWCLTVVLIVAPLVPKVRHRPLPLPTNKHTQHTPALTPHATPHTGQADRGHQAPLRPQPRPLRRLPAAGTVQELSSSREGQCPHACSEQGSARGRRRTFSTGFLLPFVLGKYDLIGGN